MPETDTFVPLRDWLQETNGSGGTIAAASRTEPIEAEFLAGEPEVAAEATIEVRGDDDDHAGALADARRFRAALADALEFNAQQLLRDIACDVLGRELRSGCDLHALVRSAIERYGITPLRVRAHPSECVRLTTLDWEIVSDASLRRGDVILELQCGSIDARLGTRLERVLSERR